MVSAEPQNLKGWSGFLFANSGLGESPLQSTRTRRFLDTQERDHTSYIKTTRQISYRKISRKFSWASKFGELLSRKQAGIYVFLRACKRLPSRATSKCPWPPWVVLIQTFLSPQQTSISKLSPICPEWAGLRVSTPCNLRILTKRLMIMIIMSMMKTMTCQGLDNNSAVSWLLTLEENKRKNTLSWC